MLFHVPHIRDLNEHLFLPILLGSVIELFTGIFHLRKEICMLVLGMVGLLNVSPELFYECVPVLFLGHF